MDAYVNLATSTVATAPSPDTSGTSLVVAAGTGVRYPAAPFDVTLYAPGTKPDPTNAEIARCTAVSTDTLTLTRAQYGTTAQPVAVGWYVDNDVTANFIGQLVAVSSASYAGKNAIINGGMDIWQRGTSFTYGGSALYTADRWQGFIYPSGAGLTLSQVASGLTGFTYALRVQRNSGTTNTSNLYATQSLETVNSLLLAGQTVTISFYARCGANFSPASNTAYAVLTTGTGTDQNVNSGFTGASNVINAPVVLTTSWQRFTETVTLGSAITQLGFALTYAPTGTAGTDDYFDITGVQLELGSVATPFSRAGGSIGGELALCQRYYWQVSQGAGGFIANGICETTSQILVLLQLPTVLRAPAAVTATSGTAYYYFSEGAANVTANAPTSIPYIGTLFIGLRFATLSGSVTAGGAVMMYLNNSSTAISASAEL